jgi:hypothetical protein
VTIKAFLLIVLVLAPVAVFADVNFKATSRGQDGKYQEAVGVEVLPAYYIPGVIALLDVEIFSIIFMFYDLEKERRLRGV